MVMILNSKPRIAGRQVHRDNVPSSNVEDYYRITLYDEFLSHVVAEMEARFVNNPAHKLAIGLLYLLPTKCMSLSLVPSELKEAIQFFSSDLPNPVRFSIGYSDWVRKWKSASTPGTSTAIIPEQLMDSYKQCSSPHNIRI